MRHVLLLLVALGAAPAAGPAGAAPSLVASEGQTSGAILTRPAAVAVPLRLHVRPRTIVTGQRLVVDVCTAAHARVRVLIQVLATRPAIHPPTERARGGSRVAYRAMVSGHADAHGHFTARRVIGYRPARPTVASLAVTVRWGQRSATRTVQFRIRPARRSRPTPLARSTAPTPTPLQGVGPVQPTSTATATAGPTSTAMATAEPTSTSKPPLGQVGDPVIAGAGNIACDPASPSFNRGSGTATTCQQRATSDLLVTRPLAAVFTLGDNQYETGSPAAFGQAYDPTWGRVKTITHPAIGNHDYLTAGAAGYFGYFGAAAGDPARGYYSYTLGTWHIVVLNGECSQVGGCGTGSPQEQWLRADLAAHPAICTLAYWHEPRFSSGTSGGNVAYDAFWRDLYAAGADVVLSAHDHDYERFAPQSPDGVVDQARGIRELVVGTGGKSHGSFRAAIRPNSEVRNNSTFGVLELTLHPGSYDWTFVPIAGQAFTDTGSMACH